MMAEHDGDDGYEPGANTTQLAKVARVLKAVTLFWVDVALWTLLWPRGTRFDCRTLSVVVTRYLLQGIGLLISYAFYGTLMVSHGHEKPTFVTDSTSRLLGLPSTCSRYKRAASWEDLLMDRGDQGPSEELLDDSHQVFMEAIKGVESSFLGLDTASAIEATWGDDVNKSKTEHGKVGNFTSVPLEGVDEKEVESFNELGSGIFNSTADSGGQDNTTNSQEENFPAAPEGSGGLNTKELEVSSNVTNQDEAFSDNQPKVDVMIKKLDEQFDNSLDDPGLLAFNHSAMDEVFSLKTAHPGLFPGGDRNETKEGEQTDSEQQEELTEKEQEVINVVLGMAYTVLALTVLMVIYVLAFSDFSICKARNSYLIKERNARSQQGLAHLTMRIASERESVRVQKKTLEEKLESENLGKVAVLTGLEEEQPGDYTIDLQEDLEVKESIDEKDLKVVQERVSRNLRLVKEMNENLSG